MAPQAHSTQTGDGSRETIPCIVELMGWRIHVAQMQRREERELGNVMDLAIKGAFAHLLRCHPDGRLEASATIVAIREGLRRLGIDPRKTPPVSEILISEFLRDKRISRGSLAWEFLALLTAKSEASWSVLDRKTLTPPLTFRLGKRGERITTQDGFFDAEGLPVLADREGVKASPWTRCHPSDLDECSAPVFVCYLPRELFHDIKPKSHVGRAVWLTWAYRFVLERSYSFQAGAE